MLDGNPALTLAAMASETKRRKCIAAYHAMLEQIDIKKFAESIQNELLKGEVKYGDRMTCPFLRPSFVTREQVSMLSERISKITAAVQLLAENILHDADLQNFLGLTETEKELIAFEPGFKCMAATSRFDTFLNGGDCSCVEYNAESPAGMGYSDAIRDAFMKQPECREFAEKYHIGNFDLSRDLLKALMECWEEWRQKYGGPERPVIAIVDYEGLPTYHEFVLLQKYFISRGYKCIIADPRRLDYDGQRLSYQGCAIDFIYRRVLTNEFIDRFAEVQNMYRAIREHKVCSVNSFRSKLLHKKSIFALLTDEKYHELFTDEQINSIRACIPWTRRWQEGKTSDPEGAEIDLREFVLRNQNKLVLKPNDSYGGRGIYFGWEMNAPEWQAALDKTLEHDYLLQFKLTVPRELFPVWNRDKGAVEWGEYHIDLDPYVCNGTVSGATARLSLSSLCNVTSGGGSVACMIVE